jgi:hypothetical protein
MSLIGSKKMTDKSILQLNWMVAKVENGGSGSRMLAEVRHYANRNRFTNIIASAVPTAVGYYKKSKFVPCDFSKLFGDTYKYIAHHPDNIQM